MRKHFLFLGIFAFLSFSLVGCSIASNAEDTTAQNNSNNNELIAQQK